MTGGLGIIARWLASAAIEIPIGADSARSKSAKHSMLARIPILYRLDHVLLHD